MPVATIAGKSGSFDAQDGANIAVAQQCQQSLEACTVHSAA